MFNVCYLIVVYAKSSLAFNTQKVTCEWELGEERREILLLQILMLAVDLNEIWPWVIEIKNKS